MNAALLHGITIQWVKVTKNCTVGYHHYIWSMVRYLSWITTAQTLKELGVVNSLRTENTTNKSNQSEAESQVSSSLDLTVSSLLFNIAYKMAVEIFICVLRPPNVIL